MKHRCALLSCGSCLVWLSALLVVPATWAQSAATAPHVQTFVGVRLKQIARVEGVEDNALIGYGLVVGLSGSGDTRRNAATRQSLANMLSHFGVSVGTDELNSRNVAAVMVTASLPAFAESGQKLDVTVSSIGDARSLSGGTLLLTPLDGADGKVYALAQGAVSVGGYKFQASGSMQQKNYPTAGHVPEGAIVQRAAPLGLNASHGTVNVLLYQPDFTTATRIVQALQRTLPGVRAFAAHAGKVVVHLRPGASSRVRAISAIENVMVKPDQVARVVVDARTGTVVSGGDVRLASVTISQGDLRISIKTDYRVSQPGGIYFDPSRGVRSVVVPHSTIHANETPARMVQLHDGATVADLIQALHSIHLSTRDVISVLQSIKAAGALHGQLLIQ